MLVRNPILTTLEDWNMHGRTLGILAGLFLGLRVLAGASGPARAEVRIESALYSVSVDPAQGRFAVVAKSSGKAFLTDGRLRAAGGTARTTELSDKLFGRGQAAEINYPDGHRESLSLFSATPFVVFRRTLHNGGREPLVLKQVPAVSAIVDLGKTAAEAVTLGTGGLLPPAKNPGSYALLAVADPLARSGVVAGWLTHERGSGVVFSPVEGEKIRLQAQIDYGRLRIQPGQDAALESLAIGYFDDVRLGLEAYADAVAQVYSIRLPPNRAGYCTWYMEKHGGASNEKQLLELSAYAAQKLKPFGFDFIQIDDGWQEGLATNGPKKNFTTHAPGGPYPGGMKATADAIRRLGLTPGIWFMPFAGNHKDPYFQDHLDWFAKGPDGKPYETPWGGTCLDLTQPGAREHVKEVSARIARDWGYRVFKLDGFWTGSATRQIYVNDGYKDDAIGEAGFADAEVTNIQALRSGARLLREAAGPEVFLLGCCVSQNMRSLGGAFGLVDAMRVGPDTGAGHIGAPHASRLWFLNGRVWWNDPDCVSVRAATPLEQARLNASFTAIAGDLFYNSDWMPDLPPERLDILRRSIPSHGLASRPVDVLEHEPARIWHLADVRQTRRRDVVALYNWDKGPVSISESAERIGLPPAAEYVGFDFWANRFVPPFKQAVRAELPAGGSCRILAVQPVLSHPQVLSTSRHVTQGMVDLAEERWDQAQRTLTGTSKLVAGDPYELRIVVPVGERSWNASAASVSAADRAAGVDIAFKQDGPKLRVVVNSPACRDVKWQVEFAPAGVQAGAPRPVSGLRPSVEYRQISLAWDDNGAEAYRVTRSDGRAWTSASAALVDRDFQRGKPYRYSVAAVGWDGRTSAAASIEVSPMAELKLPPAPPLPNVYLDALRPRIVENGWGKPGLGLSVSGKPLSILGKRHEKGLGVHARSVVLCPVPAGASRFVAVVGLDDAQRADERSSVGFEVYGDVQEMGERPVLLGQSPVLSTETIRAWTFNLELNARFKQLQLVVTDAGNGIAADHADWVDAGFLVAH